MFFCLFISSLWFIVSVLSKTNVIFLLHKLVMIATRGEYQVTVFRSKGKIPRTKLPTKVVPSNMLIARFGAMLDQTFVHMLPSRSYNMIGTSIWNGFLVAVGIFGGAYSLILLHHPDWIVAELIRSRPALV